ncbi:hypothetical protein PoB_001263200 [Plakobranchus ocellatus]|uniref:Uncharacterized protein n=1 Tax=Plakobranchus ocellatus TaxID=259542 RepID=A0AAV3YUH8_9GAST|nr:hypothetical protein PoB_001263200 [Plakobranchus ocellatus]
MTVYLTVAALVASELDLKSAGTFCREFEPATDSWPGEGLKARDHPALDGTKFKVSPMHDPGIRESDVKSRLLFLA